MLEDFPTDKIPGFAECAGGPAARSAEPHLQPGQEAAGFVERLYEGTWVGHVAEHVALQLQQAVGHDMRRGKTRAGEGRSAAATT